MTDYRNILRLHSLGHSQREMERELSCSRHTISEVLVQAAAVGISWPLDDSVTNEDIQEILFPGRYAFASPYTVPDFQYIHEELAKKGVTLTLLWEEYCQRVRAAGGVPYMYTQFCEKYRRWARVTKATMRISHKPGDAMQVDWPEIHCILRIPLPESLRPFPFSSPSFPAAGTPMRKPAVT